MALGLHNFVWEGRLVRSRNSTSPHRWWCWLKIPEYAETQTVSRKISTQPTIRIVKKTAQLKLQGAKQVVQGMDLRSYDCAVGEEE